MKNSDLLLWEQQTLQWEEEKSELNLSVLFDRAIVQMLFVGRTEFKET